MLLAALVAIAALMLAAAPAFANNNNNNHFNRHDFCDVFGCHNDFHPVFVDHFQPFGFDNGIGQANEQDVQSGAVSQGVIVEGGGANSNQCVGVQPIANTGNATNNTGVVQANPFNNGFDNRFFDDGINHRFFNDGFGNGQVDIQDTGNLTISPSQTVTCSQQVNQAATASG
jgi:hypothetical protein